MEFEPKFRKKYVAKQKNKTKRFVYNSKSIRIKQEILSNKNKMDNK